MSAELIVVNGPLAGTRYGLLQGDIFIGRSTDAKVVLSEPEVSLRHCQIRQQRTLPDFGFADINWNLCQRNALRRALAGGSGSDRHW